MKISACYITKNEERNIVRSLQSLLDSVDEIIVVDTGSTDRTKEAAAGLGARVLDFAWEDDFSAPRNLAIQEAQGDWIIFLDADEWFVEPQVLRNAIEEEVRCSPDLDAMLLLRLNLDDRGTEVSRDRSLRIFRNAPWLRYHGKIHENVYSSRGRLRVSYPEGLRLYHDGYRGTIIATKIERNLRLMLQDIEENGHPERFYSGLVDCCYYLGLHKECLEFAFRGLEVQTYPEETRMGLYHVALESMRSLDLPLELMCEFMDCAQAEFPFLPEFYAEKGIVLSCMGELEQAVENLEKAALLFESSPKEELFPYFYVGGGVAYERLAQIYRMRGRCDLAMLHFLKSACFSGVLSEEAEDLLMEQCRALGIRARLLAEENSAAVLSSLRKPHLPQGGGGKMAAPAQMGAGVLLFVAAACRPQAKELIALLPDPMREMWKSYEAVLKKRGG